MNSKQRFDKICGFGKSDRVPIDYMAHPVTDAKLKAHLGCDSEEELLDRLGCDFYYLPGRDISQNEGFLPFYKGKSLQITDTRRLCPLGIGWTRGAYDSKFWVDEAIDNPLKDAQTEKDILSHHWPTKNSFDFSALESVAETHQNKVIIGGLWTGIMGDSYRLCGFENFLLNTALKPHLIKCLINRMTDMYLELNDKYFTQLNGKMDIWFFGNDFGSQDGLLLHPDVWYEFFFENIKRLTDLAHSYGLKVMMHSCGSITKIIDWLIEAGVDILDPIQVTAKDMEPEKLVEKFGGRVVFHGGVDTQQILPYGTKEEVAEHAKEIVHTLSKKGGYIFAGSQILGVDISIENIVAMYRVLNRTL